LGRFDLPEDRYEGVKVCVAQYPLAERDAEGDDPGLEETVWIERLSPCHGVIRSPLVGELGVDFGDVVLFDGAPITYHEYRGESIPVFPHLVTLARPGYAIYRFGGLQAQPKQIAKLSNALPADSLIYTHTESLRIVCRQCWEGAKAHQHDSALPQHRVVTGKLC